MYYNTTLKRVRVTIVSVEDKSLLSIMSACIIALSYPACRCIFYPSCSITICGLSVCHSFHRRHGF